MVGRAAEGALVLAQLQCSGTAAVLALMEHGYPSRAPFAALCDMYRDYLPDKLRHLQPKIFCQVTAQICMFPFICTSFCYIIMNFGV